MYAFSLENNDIKSFMNLLLCEDSFDVFRLHSCEIVTYCTFKIDGNMNSDFFADSTKPCGNRCPWKVLKQTVFNIIKGKRLPKLMKIVLSVPEDKLELLHPNCKEAFLNITYENGKLTFITGTLQHEFDLNQAQDEAFENYIKKLFKKLNLTAIKI